MTQLQRLVLDFRSGDPDERCKCCGRFLYTVIEVVYG
jgi:hypothetical protein